MKIFYLLFLPLFFSIGCSSEVNEENVLEAVLDNDTSDLYGMFFEKHKVDKDQLAKVVELYSKKIKKKNLKKVLFRDGIPDFKRKKYGALFVEDEDVLHYSVTFKFVEYPDGKKEVNFIDFRSSEDDLPSIKIPSNMPLKSIVTPNDMFPKMDSIKKANPVMVGRFKTYDQMLVSQKTLSEDYNDSLRLILAFNMRNPLIRDRFEEVLETLDAEIGLSDFTISRYNVYAAPTFYITYDSEGFERWQAENFANVFADKFGMKVRVEAMKNSSNSMFGFKTAKNSTIRVGGIYTRAKVRY